MHQRFSQTQKDILGLLAEFGTYDGISKKLRLSKKTIYNNVYILMSKVDVQSREELIEYAVKHNGKLVTT
jgi:DNA-binding CsgD family transcriptional regulator